MKFRKTLTGMVLVTLFGIISLGREVLADPPPSGHSQLPIMALQETAAEGMKGPFMGFHTYWKDGLYLEGRYEKLKINIAGSLMIDGGMIKADDGIQMAYPDLEDEDIDLRKLSLDVRGTIFDTLDFRLDIDFANVRDIKDVWIRFKQIPILDHIIFGHQKEPVSLDNQISLKNQSCPKSDFLPEEGVRDVLGTAYFGPESGQIKGQNPAVSETMDGEENEAERICCTPSDGL